MEGTLIGRTDERGGVTEESLEDDIAALQEGCAGVVLAYLSAQNIDRLVTFHRAATRVGRTLVIDVYTARILDALKSDDMPSVKSGELRVFLPRNQKRRIVKSERFDLVNPYREERIFSDELAACPSRWTMLFRSSMKADLEALGNLAGAKLIYSLWPGYLNRDEDNLCDWAASHGIGFEICHVSGHAYIQDMVRLVKAIAPRKLVPIHTSRPDRYSEIFENVEIVGNQHWCAL
jgi:ribonuclease J